MRSFGYKEGKTLNISVVGDVMLDVEMQTQPRENYEGATICLTGTKRTYYPGGAANVAVLLRGLGHNVSLFGLTGPDWAAEELCDLLGGIELHFLPLLLVTTTKTRIYDDGMMVRVDCEDPKSISWAMEECLHEFRQFRPDCVVFSDYGKGVFGDHAKAAVQRIIKHKPTIPTVVDPKPCNYSSIWDGCTIAKPNDREMDDMTIVAQAMVVTHGAGGVVLTEDSGATAIPCREVDNPQIVGAGDAFVAGVAARLSEGSNVVEAVEFAVEFATDYVSHPRVNVYDRRYEHAFG